MTTNLPVALNAPYSQEAEEAVLGAVLVNPSAFIGVAAFLKPEDFFLLRHSRIWQAFLRLSERSEPIDYLTVAQELRNLGVFDEVGGHAYLMQLINNTPTSVHAEIYGRLVERTSIRRRMLEAADKIRELALDEEKNIEAVLNEAESSVFSIGQNQIRREFVPMWEALSAYYDRMEFMLQHQRESLGVPSGFRDLDQLLGGFQKSDLIVFAGRPGMGKCAAQGTMIPTELGYIPVETLKPNSVIGIPDDEGGLYYPLEIEVQTPLGKKRTSHFYDGGIKPTLKVTTRLGYSLSATHVHPVMVLNRQGEKVWKPLAELRCGDYVAVQRHDAVWGNSDSLLPARLSSQSWAKQPRLPEKLTSQLAYVMGLIAGDGSVCQPGVHYVSADPELAGAFCDLMNSVELPVNDSRKYRYNVNSVVLNTWLHQNGLKGHSHEKEVPWTIMQSSRDCVKSFLQGLFDTDGHAEVQRGYIQFTSASEKLARQVHLLLLQFGIVSKLSTKETTHRLAWCIRITGSAARKFYDEIGFRLERKQSRRELLPVSNNVNLDVVPYLPERKSAFTRELNFTRYFRGERKPSYAVLHEIAEYAPEVNHLLEPEFYWDEIVAIEDDGLQHVYDLVVPDGHAFVANGIVSHNTSFLLTTAINAARVGARVGIFTMEMGIEQIVQRMISMESGINMQKLRLAQLMPQEQARFVEVVGRISEFPIFIDDTPAMSPMEMRTKCRRLVYEHGLDMIMIDYMQLMNAGGSKGFENNRVQEISYISRNLKELARELNIPVISAAQLSRAVEQRNDKRPVLSDLRESGSIEQDSDVVMFLYRDEVYNEATEFPNQADVIVSKHRNGPTGTISLYFEKQLTKFMDANVHRVDLSSLE